MAPIDPPRVDTAGHVYVADSNGDRIQKFDESGTFLTKWGTPGSGNGQFNDPFGIAVDASGNVYVADTFNHRIQKFDSSGTFKTKWGTLGSGNGQFNTPFGVATDAAGDVYVADSSNSRIQKFNASGTFLAEWGTLGSGDGQFNNPSGVAVDAAGDVYVADSANNRIQQFDANGAFLTKWGTFGSANDQLNTPFGIAINTGTIYIADSGNSRIEAFGIYPETSITGGPADGSSRNSGGATFTFSSNLEDVMFQCRLDGSGWGGCSAGNTSYVVLTDLTEGSHTFDVRAVSDRGVADLSPASRTWTVDTVAPDTEILTHPASLTSSPDADFTFTASEAATFKCSRDGLGFSACTGPKSYTWLENGVHTFAVKAIDAAGNRDQAATWTWTVSAPPTATALSIAAPASVPKNTNAVISGMLSSVNPNCISGQTVKLKKGSIVVQTGPTVGGGAYSFNFTVTGKSPMSVIYSGSPSCLPSASIRKVIFAT